MTVDRSIRNDLLAAFSLANLSLLRVWSALLNYTQGQSFFFTQPPSRIQYAVALANTFLLGLTLFGIIRLARRVHGRWGLAPSAAILVVASLPAMAALLRLSAARFTDLGPRGIAEIFVLVLLCAGFFLRRRLLAAGAAVLITLSPLIPIEAAFSVSRWWRDGTLAYTDQPLAVHVGRPPRWRIVWIVFDELDYRLTFPERPSGLPLPEFDRLRAGSLFADDAVSPALTTRQSVPSLLIGKTISEVSPQGPSEMLVDGAPLMAQSTIFSSVHRAGGNAAVAGWYLPYCRLFSQDLTACSWYDLENLINNTGGNFPQSLLFQQQSLFEYGYLSLFRRSLSARHRIQMLEAIRREAVRDATDPSLNLVFLHLPVPHAPHFYDRSSRTFTRRNSGAEGYADSLALADSFLGDLRAAMTAAGLWDTTTVLVTSDHKNKAAPDFDGKSDPRVPFLLKLAGYSSPLLYRESLHTVITKALLEAVFQGQVASPDQAANWLTAHRQ